jgi:uncharacterized protein involved in exopolysaccharide biosynthesis
MRRRGSIVLCVLVLASCARDEPAGRFRAAGTLIHDGLGPDDKAGWATELEILRSAAVLDEVHRALAARGSAPAPDLLRRGVTAKRRADSRVIEVAVSLDDRALAQAACNLVLSTYVERRLHGQPDQGRRAADALARELDQLRPALDVDGGDARAARAAYDRKLAQLRERELSAASVRTDVRLLDGCRADPR